MLSQNKKIIISAITLFIFSFTSLVLFLKEHGDNLEKAHVSVAHTDSPSTKDLGEINIDTELVGRVDASEKVSFLTANDGKMLYGNDSFCELLNVECENLEEYSFFDLIQKDDLREFISAHTQIIQNRERKDAIGPFIINGGEKEIIVIMSIEPIVKKDRIKYLFVEMDDITEKINNLNEENSNENPDLKIQKFDENQTEVRYTVENNAYFTGK